MVQDHCEEHERVVILIEGRRKGVYGRLILYCHALALQIISFYVGGGKASPIVMGICAKDNHHGMCKSPTFPLS